MTSLAKSIAWFWFLVVCVFFFFFQLVSPLKLLLCLPLAFLELQSDSLPSGFLAHWELLKCSEHPSVGLLFALTQLMTLCLPVQLAGLVVTNSISIYIESSFFTINSYF